MISRHAVKCWDGTAPRDQGLGRVNTLKHKYWLIGSQTSHSPKSWEELGALTESLRS